MCSGTTTETEHRAPAMTASPVKPNQRKTPTDRRQQQLHQQQQPKKHSKAHLSPFGRRKTVSNDVRHSNIVPYKKFLANSYFAHRNEKFDDDDDCVSTTSTETYSFTDSERSTSVTQLLSDDSLFIERPMLERSVSFSSVTVREYNLTVGDHPDCSQGPPVTLDWDYTEEKPVPVDDYDSKRPKREALLIPFMERRKLLHYEFGVPVKQLKEAERLVQLSRKERQESLGDGGKTKARVESAVWNIGRRLRGVVPKNSTGRRR